MIRRSGFWLTAAVLFTAMNVLGAIYAIVMREPMHAAAHVAAQLVGMAVWSFVAPRRSAQLAEAGGAPPGELSDRFRNLEQSIDAVAIEMERIGEGQRQMTDLLVDRDAPAPKNGDSPEGA